MDSWSLQLLLFFLLLGQGLESKVLNVRFRIRLNIAKLASKINYQCRSINLMLGGPVQAGELSLKVFRQPYLDIYVPWRDGAPLYMYWLPGYKMFEPVQIY